MRATTDLKKEEGLRPSTLLPSDGMHTSPVTAFQHGAERKIYIFKTDRGWFFKHDKGTDITLNIPEGMRNNLQQVFLNHSSGTTEDDRQFGCILMSLAQLVHSKNAGTHNAIINQFATAQSMAKVFEISNRLKEKNTTYANSYNYWNLYIRSIDEGQEKVDEMAFRWAKNQKFKSSKHDIAQHIEWDQLKKDTIKQTVLDTIRKPINDSGHLIRKLSSKSDEELIRYVLVAKIHEHLQSELDQVNNGIDVFKEKLAKPKEKLDTLRSKIPEESKKHFDAIIDQLQGLDDKQVQYFIDFGSITQKEPNQQKLKREAKGLPTLPFNELIVEIPNVSEHPDQVEAPFQVKALNKVKSRKFSYHFGLKKEEDAEALNELEEQLEQWNKSEQKDIKEIKKLLKGRLDIAAVFIPEYVDLKSNPTLFSDCLKQETNHSLKQYRCACFVSAALSKGIDLLDIQNCFKGIKDIDLMTALTTPIRVGARMVHYPTEFAGIEQSIHILKSEELNMDIKEQTLDRMIFLAGKQENKTKIVQAGALPVLISLLTVDSAEAKQKAAGALANLTVKNSANQTKIVQAGALPVLIGLLTDESSKVREYAAGVFMNLSNNPDNVAEILKAGALPALITLLRDGSPEAKEYAAGTIGNLAKDKRTKKKMREDKIADQLREVLKNITDEKLKKEVNHVIYKLQNFYERFTTFLKKFIPRKQKNKIESEERVNV